MSVFGTEFPVSPQMGIPEFESIVVRWIKGMQHSTVIRAENTPENLRDIVNLSAPSGEKLSLRRFEDATFSAIGARHDTAEEDGRFWRTDCILSNHGDSAFIKVRGQCQATQPDAPIDTPRRPYVVKMILSEGWGASDGPWAVTDQPVHLAEDRVDLIADLLTGRQAQMLPTVYVSRRDDGTTDIDPGKLAYDIGGLAHVVVEPSRLTSFTLMQRTGGQNPYGGSIGIAMPGEGIRRRFYLGRSYLEPRELERAIRKYLVELNAPMNCTQAWDWPRLLEAQTRRLARDLDSSSTEMQDYVAAFDQEHDELKDQIDRLKEESAKLQTEIDRLSTKGSGFISGPIRDRLGRELYEGEMSDRIHVALAAALSGKPAHLDDRTRAVCEQALSTIPLTGHAKQLIAQIKQAGKDTNEMPKRLGAILLSLGYQPRHDGKHTVYQVPNDLSGVPSQTLPNSPSEYKAGRNQASELIGHLGLREVD